MKKRFFAFVLAALLLFGLLAPAAAEDVFAIDVDALDPSRLNSDDYVAQKLSASTQGVRVRKHISDSSELAAPVRLTLTQMDSGTITFDRDYFGDHRGLEVLPGPFADLQSGERVVW